MGYYKIKMITLLGETFYLLNTYVCQKKFLAGCVAQIVLRGYSVLQDNGANPLSHQLIAEVGWDGVGERRHREMLERKKHDSVKTGRVVIKSITAHPSKPKLCGSP